MLCQETTFSQRGGGEEKKKDKEEEERRKRKCSFTQELTLSNLYTFFWEENCI